MKNVKQIDEQKYNIKLLQTSNNQLRNELAYFKRTNNLLNHQIPKIQFEAEELELTKFKLKELQLKIKRNEKIKGLERIRNSSIDKEEAENIKGRVNIFDGGDRQYSTQLAPIRVSHQKLSTSQIP